jgi:CDGSH-type Zn-finger protein
MAIEVTALKNGPLQLSGDLGDLALNDRDGKGYDLSGKPKVYLCRCGASAMKPFCDGQHQKIGFQADETAG